MTDISKADNIVRVIIRAKQRSGYPPIIRYRSAKFIFGIQRFVTPLALAETPIIFIGKTTIPRLAHIGRRSETKDVVARDLWRA